MPGQIRSCCQRLATAATYFSKLFLEEYLFLKVDVVHRDDTALLPQPILALALEGEDIPIAQQQLVMVDP